MVSINTEEEFLVLARQARRGVVHAIWSAKKGHLGGALSATDILVSLYASGTVTIAQPGQASERPLILSKGHSATAILSVVDLVAGIEQLKTYNIPGTLIGNNPCEKVVGMEFHTGSLGHGPGLAAGVALAKRLEGNTEPVVVLMSDGEFNEGSVWEAVQFIATHKLNVCILVDVNDQICEDYTKNASLVPDPSKVFEGFGMNSTSLNGHDYRDLQYMNRIVREQQEPRAVLLRTIKGRGVSFMERTIRWHHSIPTDAEYEAAIKELAA